MSGELAASLLLKALAVVVLVGLNGFFVAAEFALVKIRDTQLRTLIGQGNRLARVTRRVVQNLDASLSACQVGITLASLALGWVGEPIFGALLGKVTYISPDALVEQTKDGDKRYYRVLIAIEVREFNDKDGQKLNVLPGMTAMSEIKLKDRTVLSYLTKPITRTLNQGTGDR